jgi:phosphoribosylformylglycinamidine synthase
MGASALAQVYGQLGNEGPDLDDPRRLASFFALLRQLRADDGLLAYHDISDGGLLATLAEMAFASRCGLDIRLDDRANALAELFAEELGAVAQISRTAANDAIADAARHGIHATVVGQPTKDGRIRVSQNDRIVFDEARVDLHRAWSKTTHAMQRLRDNPHPPTASSIAYWTMPIRLAPHLTFDPNEKITAPFMAARARPAVAIVREQGVNGHVEMAAAFDRAGFDAFDVHMTDLMQGRRSLAEFKGIVAGGGFSYGDVLGAGEGWAKSILFSAHLRDDFAAFLRATRFIRARRVQRLPNDGQSARVGSRRRSLAAFREKCVGAVRGTSRPGGDPALAIAVFPRDGR